MASGCLLRGLEVCLNVCHPPSLLLPPTIAGMVLAMDETPLMYAPPVRGTYTVNGAEKQVVIIGTREKRAITGSPIIASNGELFAFQMLFKGGTDRSRPRLPPTDTRIWYDHSASHMQTSFTFGNMLTEIHRRLPEWRLAHGLPAGYPALVLLDHAPTMFSCTQTCELQEGMPPAHACQHLFTDLPGPRSFSSRTFFESFFPPEKVRPLPEGQCYPPGHYFWVHRKESLPSPQPGRPTGEFEPQASAAGAGKATYRVPFHPAAPWQAAAGHTAQPL